MKLEELLKQITPLPWTVPQLGKAVDVRFGTHAANILPKLVEAMETQAQRLESLEPVHLNWHLFTGEVARAMRAALAEAQEVKV